MGEKQTLNEAVVEFRNLVLDIVVGSVLTHWRLFLVFSASLVLFASIVQDNDVLIPAYFCGLCTGLVCMTGAIADGDDAGDDGQ